MTSKSRNWCLVGLAAVILPILAARATDLQPPKAQVVDRFRVNMTNGQVTHSLSTVGIGGAMGLTDSISVDANVCREPSDARMDDVVIT
jgi:hypothetical protein